MKNVRTILINFVFFMFLFVQNSAFADDFLLPDWNYYKYKTNVRILENADIITYQQVRNNQNFDNFFDSQIISIHKNQKNIDAKTAGNAYLSRTLMGDFKNKKYIIQNDKDNFEAIFCSSKLQRCEIVRFFNGYRGLIELKYIHNNLWHFQNNIGSFVEFQNRIVAYPNESIIRELTEKYYLRLE